MLPQPKLLQGHTSEATAHVVQINDKCSMRFWVETNEHGQRVCSQTSNPDKPDTWNKISKTKYAPLRVLYVNANTGRIEDAGLTEHATKKEVDAFLDKFGADKFADEYSCKTLELLKRYRQLMMERYANDPTIVQVGPPSESE